ncbi:uncharacterized protein LOC115718091 [Cannabis sativa]|uniref:uncharacterized protein LOC115718091 n=1 Tax=Cannabis sativa TaxID=3483 RepID=UPI0029C9C428|nr:uncharacterized protein LOC115718091 [Cannabis sativa]
MAASSQHVLDLNEQYAQISLDDEEEGILIGGEEEGEEFAFDDRWCLVGKFLTGRTLDFDPMRHIMASLWQPGKGVYIRELDTNRYLFQFYHELDVQSVVDGSPWTFNKCPLVFHRLRKGEDPKVVHLHKMDFWVQLHDLKSGFMLERVVKSAGEYIGGYAKSDPKNFNGIWRDYLQVRATIDVNKPLKQRMKLCKENGADEKKKNYLIGAQWLQTRNEASGAVGGGGVSRASGAGCEASYSPKIMEVDRHDDEDNHDPMILGKNQDDVIKDGGVDHGQDIGEGQSQIKGGNVADLNEDDLLLIIDHKRRRMGKEKVAISGDKAQSKVDNEVDCYVDVAGSKNGSQVGLGSQAHPSL